MFFKRFYDEWLAQTSYLVGCAASGEAIVVDPSRVIEPYLRAADDEGLRITAVTETHIHADFLSGLRELAAATGAAAAVSGCGPEDWQYRFRSDPGVSTLADRDILRIGNVHLQAVHTPGHTPEHVSFLVTDTAGASEAMGILSGDFVFVGDVGRPDLLEKAARLAGTTEAAAQALFESLRWFRTLPDHLQVWPGHGAGSACGKGLSAVPQSTVGYERRFNWALGIDDAEEFVRQVVLGQPEPPRYFGVMKRMNREGPPILGTLPDPRRATPDEVETLIRRGALLVDTRDTSQFAGAHAPGALNIPLGRNFSTYAGSILPYDRDLVFLMADAAPDRVRALVNGAVSIGLDRIEAVVDLTLLDAVAHSGRRAATVAQIGAEVLIKRSEGRLLIDVRNLSEWEGGHLPGATLLPLPELADRLDEVPTDSDIVVLCQGGGRSAVAASFLKAHGRSRVTNLTGGFSAWVAAGGEVVHD